MTSATISFRGKQFQLALNNNSFNVGQFIELIAGDPECELTVGQLQQHILFARRSLDGRFEPIDANELLSPRTRSEFLFVAHLQRVCPICQTTSEDDVSENIGDEYDGAVFTLFCSHTVHRACFAQMSDRRCPLCRDAALSAPPATLVQPIQVQSSAPTVYAMPEWCREDNSALPETGRYVLSADGNRIATSQGHGMFIFHSAPLSGERHYRFTVTMDPPYYCSATLLTAKQPLSHRDFGRDYAICPPLRENIHEAVVHFDIDMDRQTARIDFPSRTRGSNRPRFLEWHNLPDTVYLACVVKSGTAVISRR
jgi:hypothetical protein